MLPTVFASILAFIGTNIDDILVLTVLFSRGRGRKRIALGYLLGVAALTALSVLAASGLSLFSGGWLRLLGLIPIALGVRALLARDDDGGEVRPSLSGAALITLGNGADNLGVYTALFARSAPGEIAVSALIFLLTALLWTFIASRLASLPSLRRFIERRSRILVPAVFILLGIWILLL